MFESIIDQIISMYLPQKVLLFGSQAKGNGNAKSDIDLCIIANVENKRKTLADMYYSIESDRPIDILLYNPNEWEQCVCDPTSFAYKINAEGKVLYGG